MPYAESWQQLDPQLRDAVLKGSPEEIRAQVDGLIQILLPHFPAPPEDIESTDGEVDGVKYRVYKPKSASGPLPVGIWTHGGGYMVGDLNSDDLLCRAISEHTSTVIVNVDYRLSPEHKWPVQLDDSMAVYKWAHQNAASIGGDQNKFYTVGGSAGGGLALGIANRVLKDPQLKSSLKGIIGLCPVTCHPDAVPTEYKSMYKSMEENATGVAIIDKESMQIFLKHVEADPNDPDAFVALATDNHKNFPPTYFASCGCDPLRDDSYIMEEALKKAGVATKHDHYKGFPHYFWIFPFVPESHQFIGNVVGGIEWVKSQM